MPEKRCSRCHQVFLATTEYFPRQKSSCDGLRCYCKPCHATKERTRRQNRPGVRRPYKKSWADGQWHAAIEAARVLLSQGLKRCAKCEQVRQVANFSPDADDASGLEAYCKPCQAQRAMVYYWANPDACQARHRTWLTVKAPEVKVYKQTYNAAHAAEIKAYRHLYNAAHAADGLAQNRRWHAANPGMNAIYCQERRARRLAAPINDLTMADWLDILVVFKWRCAYCGKRLTLKTASQDHITPYTQHGPNTKSNVVPACKSCNSQKKDGPPLCPVQPLLL